MRESVQPCIYIYGTAKNLCMFGSSVLYPVEVSLPDLTKNIRSSDPLLYNPKGAANFLLLV